MLGGSTSPLYRSLIFGVTLKFFNGIWEKSTLKRVYIPPRKYAPGKLSLEKTHPMKMLLK